MGDSMPGSAQVRHCSCPYAMAAELKSWNRTEQGTKAMKMASALLEVMTWETMKGDACFWDQWERLAYKFASPDIAMPLPRMWLAVWSRQSRSSARETPRWARFYTPDREARTRQLLAADDPACDDCLAKGLPLQVVCSYRTKASKKRKRI